MSNEAVGRRRKKVEYVQIQNSMFEDNQLTWKAKGLLGYMLSRPDNWIIRYSDLVKRSTDGEKAIKSAIKELKKYGYLSIVRIKGEKGRFTGALWEYDDVPIIIEEVQTVDTEGFSPYVQNAHVENAHMHNAHVQNLPHINKTNCNNTDFNKTKDKNLVNKTVNNHQEIIDRLVLDYMKKGLPKELALRAVSEIDFKKVENVGGYLRGVLENVLYRHKTKNGTVSGTYSTLLDSIIDKY
jgi:hypothetical protein